MKRAPSILAHLRDVLILPFTVTVIIPYLIERNSFHWHPVYWWVSIAGIVIGASGFCLFCYTVWLFHIRGKGTLAPWNAPQKLVISGPYRYCRNPMITGVFFILTGETLWLHSRGLLIWTILFYCINTTYFILKEEPDLEKRFGDAYRKYKQQVPRWLPRLKPYKEDEQ